MKPEKLPHTASLARVGKLDRLVDLPGFSDPPHAFFIFCPRCNDGTTLRDTGPEDNMEGGPKKLFCKKCKRTYFPYLKEATEPIKGQSDLTSPEPPPEVPKTFSLVFCIIKPNEDWLGADGKKLREVRPFFETDLDTWSAIVPDFIDTSNFVERFKDAAGDSIAFCLNGINAKHRSLWEKDAFSYFALNRFLDEAAEAGIMVSNMTPVDYTFPSESGLHFRKP